jgi:cation diffusion facilitator family transporter
MSPQRSARFYATLSVGAALLTIALKLAAYFLTRSVGLLSDALESGVNLVAALVAVWSLTVAAKPPDHKHTFGYSKAEYFSSGVEGGLILVAAIGIVLSAWPRLWHPQPLEELGLGMALSLLASGVNGGMALVLLRAGQRLKSVSLQADARHLLTDVWTSIGVVLSLILVPITGQLIFDPVIALVVAANIVWAGIMLLRETTSGLLDIALPIAEQRQIEAILSTYQQQGIQFHSLQTRVAGSRGFVLLHVLVPGAWTVQKGHDLCEELEQAIAQAIPNTHVTTHLEPLEDPVSWNDSFW